MHKKGFLKYKKLYKSRLKILIFEKLVPAIYNLNVWDQKLGEREISWAWKKIKICLSRTLWPTIIDFFAFKPQQFARRKTSFISFYWFFAFTSKNKKCSTKYFGSWRLLERIVWAYDLQLLCNWNGELKLQKYGELRPKNIRKIFRLPILLGWKQKNIISSKLQVENNKWSRKRNKEKKKKLK